MAGLLLQPHRHPTRQRGIRAAEQKREHSGHRPLFGDARVGQEHPKIMNPIGVAVALFNNRSREEDRTLSLSAALDRYGGP